MRLEILLRPLQTNDSGKVGEILTKIHSPGLPRWSMEQIESEIVGASSLGAFEEENLLGFLFFKKALDHVDVLLLATHPDRQGQGIMTLLFAELKKIVPGLPIWLEVHEQNVRARKFYENQAFKEVGRRSNYYRDKGAAVLYTLVN